MFLAKESGCAEWPCVLILLGSWRSYSRQLPQQSRVGGADCSGQECRDNRQDLSVTRSPALMKHGTLEVAADPV